MMKINTFQMKAEILISKLQALIDHVPQKGDKAEDCQKLTLLNALSEFEYAVNGTTQKDLDKD